MRWCECAAPAERFECKDPTWLSVRSPTTLTGMDISLYTEDEQLMYSMGHGRDLRDLLHAKGLGEEKLIENPMADKRVLTDSEEISENLQSWCRSVIGGLHYYARGTRYDISYAISRVSQTLGHPTRSNVRALEQIAGYLLKTQDFC